MSHWTSSRRRSAVACVPQELDEPDEGGLRGVGAHMEHRLGGEQPADRDAVQPAGETVGVPGLDGVRPAELVQLPIRGLDARVDPAGGVPRPRTSPDHVREGRVDPDLVAPSRPAERARGRKGLERHDTAPRRREPADASAHRHGEEAEAIRREEGARLEVGADRPEIVAVVVRRRLEPPRRGRGLGRHASHGARPCSAPAARRYPDRRWRARTRSASAASDRRRRAGRRPVDDPHEDPRRRGDDGADRRARLRRLRDRPRRRPEEGGRAGAAADRPPLAGPGDRRHPLQRLARPRRDRRRGPRRSHQPRQHRRAGQDRAGREGRKARRDPDADRRQRRLAAEAPRGARARGHGRGARRRGARAGRDPRAARLPRLQDLGQGLARADDDPRVPDALREGALPAPPRRHRGGDAVRRVDQERRRHGGAPDGRHRRHDARLAHRRPREGGRGRLGDPEGARAARARAGDDRVPVVRARQRRSREPRGRRRGASARLPAGVRGRGDGLRGERPGRGG